MPVHTLQMDPLSRPQLRPSPGADDRDRIYSPRTQPDSEQNAQSGKVSPFRVSQSNLRETLDRHPGVTAPLSYDDSEAPASMPQTDPSSNFTLMTNHEKVDALHSLAELSAAASQRQHHPVQPTSSSSEGTSQQSGNTIESDSVFSPPASQAGMRGRSDEPLSSQESQLLQLSQIASIQDRLAEVDHASSRKRMADGEVKERTSTSPVRSHSRNTSTVSMASTTASTIGDLSSDLKTRLSYAMVKLNHGWQSHSIEEVESMASQAGSPASSHSTLPGRNGSSASPRLNIATRNPPYSGLSSPNPSPAAAQDIHQNGNGLLAHRRHNSASPPEQSSHVPALAPPAPIQPSRPATTLHPRRSSNARHTPTFLSHAQNASTSPHTPGHHNPLQRTPDQRAGGRTPADPVFFSPRQNVREQDAIDGLLFMGSPGNSANMKHGYAPASASQPLPSRHALPTPQPRKTLPNHKPQVIQKRVEFEKSPSTVSDMDIDSDSKAGTPRGVVRRRMNGGSFIAQSPRAGIAHGHRSQLSLPAGLGSGHAHPRQRLADEDIERMLDRVAQNDNDSSDDEDIQIPDRREGAGIAS